MIYPMLKIVCRYGFIITYKCYQLPGHGKKCKDKNTDKCLRCKFSKAEMSGETATRLMKSYGKKIEDKSC